MNDLTKIESINFNELDKIFTQMNLNTKSVYLTAINQFLDYYKIGINQLNTITPSEIKKYINYLLEHYKNSSVNLKINSLKSLYKKFEVLYQVKNPFRQLSDMKIKTNFWTDKKAVDKVLTSDEIEKLLKYLTIKNNYSNKRNFALIKLLNESGLRISEALNIRYEDISKVDSYYVISILKTKGNKYRKIFINQELYNLLINLKRDCQEYVFMTKDDNRLSRQIACREFKKLGLKVLKKNFHPHQLRHSFITRTIAKTQNISGISTYVGHQNVATTLQMYNHNQIKPTDLFETL